VTFAAVIAVVILAVTDHGLAGPMGSDTRGLARADATCRLLHPQALSGKARNLASAVSCDSCIACFKADLAAQGKRTRG
jgi:hypothetical protein